MEKLSMYKNRLGIIIGSFNPIHNGHLIMANYVLNENLVDKVHIVPSPGSFGKAELIDFQYRIDMLHLATLDIPNVVISDVETKLTGYTADTLRYYKNTYPESEIYLIIGRDNLKALKNFKDYEWINKNIPVIVLNRVNEGEECLELDNKESIITDFPLIEISSSKIRKYIREDKDIWAYVPRSVRDYIKQNKLYE